MADDTTYWKIAGVILAVGLLLMVILLPLSFSDVEYYEIAFKQRKSTGTVYTDEVYSGGRHLIGPDYKFKHYQADAHLVEFTSTDLDVSTSDKLSIQLTAHMQYFLREEDLHELHRRFDKGYKPIVRNTAKTAIKNAAKVFSKDEFRHSREVVERALFKAVRKALGGICCRKDCSKYECMKDCKIYSNCTSEDKGIFVDARYFQLHDFDITETLKDRWLDQVIKRENTEKESYIQAEQIEEKLTEQKKEEYENRIREVNEAAAANVTIIDARADAESLRIVEEARNQGLELLYTTLNFENEQHKASFNYLRTLRKHKNIRLHVNFGNLISGPNTGN